MVDAGVGPPAAARPSVRPRRRGEWRFVAGVIVAVLVVTSAPYAFAVLSAPPDQHFVGFILNVPDHAQYLAWYRAFQRAWVIPNPLTAEPNAPLFFNLLWWGLGRAGRFTGLSYALIYQGFRWLAGGFFLVMVYASCAQVFDDERRRRTAFLVITCGAGLGWVLVIAKYALGLGDVPWPLDVYVAEGNSFLCVLAYPHFAEAAGLILAVFCLLLVGERTGRLRHAVAAGMVAQLLGWQHGYDLLIVWVVPAVYVVMCTVLDRRLPAYWLRAVVIVGALSWPPAVYAVLLTRWDPMWAQVLRQYADAGVFTPRPWHMFILAGVPLVVAVATLFRRAVEAVGAVQGPVPTPGERFVVTWFGVGWALCYVPTDYQVHLINSWQVPVGLLATLGSFRYVTPWLSRRWSPAHAARVTATVLVIVTLPTTLYLWAWRFYDLSRYDYPYYLHRDDVAALRWLEAHSPDGAVVLGAYDTTRFVPGLAGRRPVLGHWAQTVDFQAKRQAVAEFFAAETADARRQEILGRYDVDYVIVGPAERRLGSYTPEATRSLTPVFEASQTQVYAVRSAPGQWSVPTMVSPSSGPNEVQFGWFPDVTVDRRGRTHLFWAAGRPDRRNQYGGYDTVVHCRVRGTRCPQRSDAVEFEWRSGVWNGRPKAVVDAENRLHLLVRAQATIGGAVDIFYTRAPADAADDPGAWTAPTLISDHGYVVYSSIAIDGDGVIHVVWTDRVPAPEAVRSGLCPGYGHLRYRRSSDGGTTWSSPMDLTPAAFGAERPHLVVGAAGAIHVLWDEGPDAHHCKSPGPLGAGIVSSYDAGATWHAPVMFAWPDDAPQRVSGAYDGRRQLVAVWGLLKARRVYYQVSSDRGRTWSAPQQIPGVEARSLENDLDDYHVAAGPDGHLHLLLVGHVPGSERDATSVLHLEWNGAAWSEPAVVFSSAGDVAEWPRLAVGPGDDLHAVWFVRDQPNVWRSESGRYRVWYAERSAAAVSGAAHE